MILSVYECVIEPVGAAAPASSNAPASPLLWQARVVASFGSSRIRYTAVATDAVPVAWAVPQDVVQAEATACEKRIYSVGPGMSVFDWWMKLHADGAEFKARSDSAVGHAAEQQAKAWQHRSATVFVRSLAERALVRALQEATGASVAELAEKNLLKIELGKIYRPLTGHSPAQLAKTALTDDPVRLARLRASGVDAFFANLAGGATPPGGFVLSLQGNPEQDAAWVLEVLERALAAGLPVAKLRWGIDGEGRYDHADSFGNFWELCESSGAVGRAEFGRPAFVVQPLASALALGNAMVALFARWPRRPSVLLDGGHDGPQSGALALDRGYGGFCFRGSRGPILGMADACMIALRQKHEPLGKWMLFGGGSATRDPQPWAEQMQWRRLLGLAEIITPVGMSGTVPV